MEHTAYNIETQITLLPSLLKVFENFKMCMWYDNENFEENLVDDIGISCSNRGKTTGLYKIYKAMVTKFVLNSVLQRVGLS